MNNKIQIFKNSEFGEIRTAGTAENPLFCLADICKAVELSNPSSVRARLDAEDVQLLDLHALNYTEGIGNSKANFVTEPGFYDVILQSSSPKVKPFRKWVTSEVLPSIRRHGAYMTENAIERAVTEPDFLIRLATEIKRERELRSRAEHTCRVQQETIILLDTKVSGLEREVDSMKEKVSYLDIILATKNSVLVTQIAQDYGESPVRFNRRLREMGIQYSRGKQWILYAPYKDCGYVTSETYLIRHRNGTEEVRMNTKWTQKGRRFLYEKLKGVGIIPVIERK